MKLEEFLKKYKCEMNVNDITKIEDLKIQEIKMKYWNLKHNAFLDEHNIKDWELGEIFDKYTTLEKNELEEYYNSNLHK